MPDPEKTWYQIFKHLMGSGSEPTVVKEVRGESQAVQLCERLEATLSEEERKTGWTYYRSNHGSAKRKSPAPPRIKKPTLRKVSRSPRR